MRAEAGAMAMTRGDVSIATSTQGGFMKGLRRSLGGESFFVNGFTSASGGVVAGSDFVAWIQSKLPPQRS